MAKGGLDLRIEAECLANAVDLDILCRVSVGV